MAWLIIGPDFISTNEEVKIRIPELLTPIANLTATLVNPSGMEYNASGNLRDLVGPIITGKEFVYTFTRKGCWLLKVYDNISGFYNYHAVMAHEWPENIDMRFSAMNKLKTETERLRSVMRSEVRKNG